MAEQKTTDAAKVDSYTYLARNMARLSEKYKNGSFDDVYGAFLMAGGLGLANQWPDIQNRRVKRINTRPAGYNKDQISSMVENPDENEKGLRQVSAGLASAAKTYDLITQTYQDMMTYHWYVYPGHTDTTVDFTTLRREYNLATKIADAMKVADVAHDLVGKTIMYGKVFYTPQVSVDKAHNKVNYAYLQQLPQDWCKIVGFNNGPGKYTVAFNMMYFYRSGTDWRQFGRLFAPYVRAWHEVTYTDSKYVYSSVDVEKFKNLDISKTPGHPEWAYIGGEYMYWVTLPADQVVVFDVNDRNDLAVPLNTGLLVSMTQIPNYEAAQMEVVLSPLTSILTGSLETYDPKGSIDEDPIRVSPTVRKMFEALWYQMLDANNTSGIGVYLAPANDLKLQTLSDTVTNTDITSTALSDQVLKAGLPALIPTTNDPKVGVAQLSAYIHANLPTAIYREVARVMNFIYEQIGFKGVWKFRMFGNVFTDADEMENARKGMTLGILTDTMRYDAMLGHSLLEDMAISDFIDKSGVMNKRIPLVTTYSAKNGDGNLPPQAKSELNPGGRPSESGSQYSETRESWNWDE